MEPHTNCSYDHVAVYDGDSLDSPLLMMHCGRDLPQPPIIRSTSNKMFIRLKADGSVASKGFKVINLIIIINQPYLICRMIMFYVIGQLHARLWSQHSDRGRGSVDES